MCTNISRLYLQIQKISKSIFTNKNQYIDNMNFTVCLFNHFRQNLWTIRCQWPCSLQYCNQSPTYSIISRKQQPIIWRGLFCLVERNINAINCQATQSNIYHRITCTLIMCSWHSKLNFLILLRVSDHNLKKLHIQIISI